MKELPKELVNPKWQLQKRIRIPVYDLIRNGREVVCPIMTSSGVDACCGTHCPKFNVQHNCDVYLYCDLVIIGERLYQNLTLDPETPIIGDEK